MGSQRAMVWDGSAVGNGLQQMHSQGQQLPPQCVSVMTNRQPLRAHNVHLMLVFQWLLFGYYLYLFCSVVHSEHYQPRMLSYCLLFLLFDKLDLTYRYCQLEDPLHLSPIVNCIRYLSYLCVLDLSFLLVRLVIDNQNLHAFLVAMHFIVIIALFINQFSKRGLKLDINVDSNSVFAKFVTPASLFVFNRTCEPSRLDFWYIELLFFGANLFIASELNRILLMKECQYFGWIVLDEHAKEKTLWKRRRALRSIIVVCCVMIVIQNLLLIFEKIKYEISVTIVHSFLVSAAAYLLYVGRLPLRK